MTVGQLLVYLPQLSERKATLNQMGRQTAEDAIPRMDSHEPH